MQCFTHPTRNGSNTCCKCGSWQCDECSIEVGGRIFCRSCLKDVLNQDQDPVPFKRTGSARKISWGLLFLFTCILPGLNYMYLGLIKRGLFALSGFFLMAYLASALNTPLFGMMIVILWVTCGFDAFQIRRRVNAGETVEDNVDDVVGFIKRNKTLFILIACILLGSAVIRTLSGFMESFNWYYGYTVRQGFRLIRSLASGLFPLLVIGAGLYLLTRFLRKDSYKPRRRISDDYRTDPGSNENKEE